MTPSAVAESPLRVFIVYAHEDKPVRDKLLRQLRPLAYNGQIDLWSDHEIKPGAVWEDEILLRLHQSDLILLLVSDDFFASNYIREVELRQSLERHGRGETRLLPVIVRHCGWEDLPALARLQVLPLEGKPVISKDWDSADEPYRRIYEGVREVLRELRRTVQVAAPTPIETPAEPPSHAPAARLLKSLALSAAFLLLSALAWWLWPKHGGSPNAESKETSGQVADPEGTSLKPEKTTLPVSPPALGADSARHTTAEEKPKQAQQKQPDQNKRLPSKSDPMPTTAKSHFDLQLEPVEGMARVRKDGQWGFLNTSTGQVIGWYVDVENFSDGRASVQQRKGEPYFSIDKKGHRVE